jgi:hypothetical protein
VLVLMSKSRKYAARPVRPTRSEELPADAEAEALSSGLGQVRLRRPRGDASLNNNLSAYATWAKANNSLLVVTWEEDDNGENDEYS